jgi:SNF2 family DNA or RNA helicase
VSFTGTLYPYQEAARDLILDEMKVLVAYEMGLGKTPLTIAAIEELADEEQIDGGVIVALSSLKYQWQKAIAKFTCSSCLGKLDEGEDGHEHTPTATSIVIDGTPVQRAKQYDEAVAGGYRYVLVNYEQVVNDWKQVRRLPRDFVVADEVTAVKSFRSQRSRRMKRLQAPYMIGLTGTPMENGKLEEVFSIMQFLNEEILGRFDIFDRTFIIRNTFGGVQRYRNVGLFRETMARSWIVKTQEDPDVAPYLPKILSTTHYVQLDVSSSKLYRTIAAELITDLGDALSQGMSGFDLYAHYGGQGNDTMDAMRGKIMAKMQALQMVCDHPLLIKHSADLYANGLVTGKAGGSEYAYILDQSGALDAALKKTPAKMAFTLELLDRALERDGNKAVLFSHDVPTLGYLTDALPKGLSTRFDGTMNEKAKEASKNLFQTDPDVRVLLSSDAGGFGVDLPQGNHLINYDMPWSNGALKQRNSRIIRASSKFPTVNLHNVLVKGSIDEWMYGKVGGKIAASDAFVLGKGLDAKGGLDITAQGLMQFLIQESP